VDDVNVVMRLVLLLGLFAAPASGQTDEPLPPPEGDEAGHAGLIEPIPLEPDSTGTRYIAPVQYVSGQRIDPSRRLDRTTNMGSVLDSREWTGQGLDAAEVLGRAAGLSVSSTGGIGAAASVSLRGSSSAQVPVYLDGVLVNRPDAGGANVGTLNLHSLERIEVYRGSAPLTLGGVSMGGAVHLQSGAGGGPLAGSVTTRSFGGLVFEGGGQGQAGAWTLSLRARALRADNDWEFEDDRGTIYNPDDDDIATRLNNDVRGGGGIATARRELGPGELALSAIADVSEHGLPGYSTRQSETARGTSSLVQGQARWSAGRSDDTRWREASTFVRYDGQGYEDPGGDLSGRVRDRTDEVITIGGAVAGALTPQGSSLWRAEIAHARQSSEDRALSDGDFPAHARTKGALALQPTFGFFDERLLVSPGARVERNFDDEENGPEVTLDGMTLQLGARWILHQNLFFKGNLGHFERVPSLFELFGDRGAVVGNPDLVTESGTNRDLGLVLSGSGRRLALGWFVNDAFDLILPVQISPVAVKFQNLSRAEIEGIELEADSGRLGPFRARAAFTRLWTEDRSGRSYAEGHPLPGRPGIVIDAALFAYAGRWTFGADYAAMDENFAQTGSRAPIPERKLIGLSTEYALGHGWSVLGRVDNLGDEQVFDLYGYPLPGRQFALSIRKEYRP
jgi:iron complex outermembrane receptor protein